MRRRLLILLDTVLHRLLDGYINRLWPGWGLLQLGQWHVCNACERARGMKREAPCPRAR